MRDPDLSQQKATFKRLSIRTVIGAVILAVLLITALAVGLAVGLTRHHSSNDDESPNLTAPNITASDYKGWQPIAGTTWYIELQGPLTNATYDVEVFDFDLFNNTASTIADLHSNNRKVICYFSAGSYEDWSPDQDQFVKNSDLGKPLDGWPGEWWLNTTSENVRRIMLSRLDLAVTKGYDGVDPDNVDAYDNDNGLGLTTDDAVDYVKFLADAAHSRHLSIGLKNAGLILPQVESLMQWSVNEQCVQYKECVSFRTMIDHGKPVFNIEYPEDAPEISDNDISTFCEDSSAKSFSTVLKKRALDDWVYACPTR